MKDKRLNNDIKAFIRSRLTGYLVDENDLEAATEILFKKSGGNFLYIVSMVGKLEGDRKWTIAELRGRPDGLDGMYREYFERILESEQETVPYDVGKVSRRCSSKMKQYLA